MTLEMECVLLRWGKGGAASPVFWSPSTGHHQSQVPTGARRSWLLFLAARAWPQLIHPIGNEIMLKSTPSRALFASHKLDRVLHTPCCMGSVNAGHIQNGVLGCIPWRSPINIAADSTNLPPGRGAADGEPLGKPGSSQRGARTTKTRIVFTAPLRL